ncbi:MAG: V-type ATP synthase subunit D [Candidatus Micrarchaeia archaeon]
MKVTNPTRMNLINLRKSINLAGRGHEILKKKREVLVVEFLKLLQESKEDRNSLFIALQEAYKSVAIASIYVGNYQLETIASHIAEISPIKITLKNIMGVNIPEIEKIKKEEKSILEKGYSLISTSTAADDVGDSFQKVEKILIGVAKREQGLKKIVIEIDKTKRRVNALEYALIPNLQAQAKYITMRLDEIDRDMFSALKHVKKKMAKEVIR